MIRKLLVVHLFLEKEKMHCFAALFSALICEDGVEIPEMFHVLGNLSHPSRSLKQVQTLNGFSR
jgi:hypothetical protein